MLSGAGLLASCSIGTAVTAIAAISTYSSVVTTSVIAMAIGTLRSGAWTSSAMLVRSSNPVKAKKASRLAKDSPTSVAGLDGIDSSAAPIGTCACVAETMITNSPATSITVKTLASTTDSTTPQADTKPSTTTTIATIKGCGRSTNSTM